MAQYGTHSVADLLATTGQSVVEFGEDQTWRGIQQMLDAHNRIVEGMMGDLVEPTTDRQRRYGGADVIHLVEIDEYGTPDAQKPAAGASVGFPLRKYSASLQWTYTYLENATPNDLVGTTRSVMVGDVRALNLAIRRAIFTPTNATVVDRLVDNADIFVKAFLNADSAPIPPDPYGNTFDASTHTHYLANTTLTTAFLESIINAAGEHYAAGRVNVYINEAQEATIRGFTAANQFTPMGLTEVVYGANSTLATGTLDPNRSFDRMIGVYGTRSARIWVKPWIPASYVFAYVSGAPKPLVLRYRNARTRNLRLVFEDEVHPLRARVMEREFGIGVWNRDNGVVAYIGGASYVAPTLVA